MKGVVFNLLESFVSENFGDAAYFDILEKTPLQTQEPFIGPATYPDSDLVALAVNVCAAAKLSLADGVRAFGKFCFPKLLAVNPNFAKDKKSATEFLLSVHDIIHVEVRKLYQDAKTPHFTYKDVKENALTVEYRSERKLCFFMEGLIEGLAQHFNEKVSYKHVNCMHQGHDHCRFEIAFEKK